MSGAQVGLPALSTFPDVIDVIEWPPQEETHGRGGGEERRPLLYVFDWLEPDEDTPSHEILSSVVPSGYDGMDMRDVYMWKMCMSSSDPVSDPNCVVVVLYSGMRYLACCKPRDSKWSAIETPWAAFENIVYHKGKFYAVHHSGRVVVIDGITDGGDLRSANAREVAAPIPGGLTGRKYLVGLPSGELLLVSRHLVEPRPHRTVNFKAFKVDISSVRPKWHKVSRLDGLTLFLGHNCPVLISPTQASGACRGNCIYFTDDYLEGYYQKSFGGHDMGIFDMETKSIERYYPTNSQLIMPPPIWIVPDPR